MRDKIKILGFISKLILCDPAVRILLFLNYSREQSRPFDHWITSNKKI